MSYSSSDAPFCPARITCESWAGKDQLVVSFESVNAAPGSTVRIRLGDFSALITREELAAAATLFPVHPPKR